MKVSVIIFGLLLLVSCKQKHIDKTVPFIDIKIEESPQKSNSGKILRIDNFPSEYVAMRNIDIWTPDGFDENKEYSVIYMHDGQMLFDSTSTWNHQEWMVDEAVAKLRLENKIPPVIIVGIWNVSERRHSDYFPEKAFKNIPKEKREEILTRNENKNSSIVQYGFNADEYLKFIVEELKPFIEREFNIKKNKKYHSICGSSMGGLISMYALCEYPDVFNGAACISTHWPGLMLPKDNVVADALLDYFSKNIPSKDDHRIYFDYGDKTLDSFYLEFGPVVDSILKEHKYSNTTSVNRLYKGQDHSERSWQKRIHIPIQFLLEKG